MFFSVIIPTYNRPQQLHECLQALSRINYPRDAFEVIVVDDGSRLSLESVVASFVTQINVELISQENAGPAAARNAGAARAKGKFLVFTDDDCRPASDWLQSLATRFRQTPGSAIGGRTINALPENVYAIASQHLIDYLYMHFNRIPNQARLLTSNNLALPAERFFAIGGFDTMFSYAAGEDRELCDEWHYRNYPMIYAPEVRVYHAHHLTLGTFWRQHYHYGCGAFRFHQKTAQRKQDTIKLEDLSFYTNLIGYPLKKSRNQHTPFLVILMVLSQIANAVGFFRERLRRIDLSHTGNNC